MSDISNIYSFKTLHTLNIKQLKCEKSLLPIFLDLEKVIEDMMSTFITSFIETNKNKSKEETEHLK